MTPNGCRWIYKHAGGMIEVRSLGADRSSRARPLRRGRRRRCRAASSSRITSRSTATTAPTRCRRVSPADGNGVVVRPVADGDVGAALSRRLLPHRCGTRHDDRAGRRRRAAVPRRSLAPPAVRRSVDRAGPLGSAAHHGSSRLRAPRLARRRRADWPPISPRADRFWQGMLGPLVIDAPSGDAVRRSRIGCRRSFRGSRTTR